MAFDGNQPLTDPPDRRAESVPNDQSGLVSDGMPATVAVPCVPDPGTGGLSRAALRRVDPDEVVGSVRSGDDPAVEQGRHAGRSAQPQRRGPKTAAGKARVGLNALTHGLSSARLVVPGESPTECETYRQAIIDALGPSGPIERALAERVVSALWRLRRVGRYEEAALAERHDLEPARARLLPHPLDLDRIIRFEAHLNRQLYQALHELEAMRAERRGQPTPLLRVDVQQQPGTHERADGAPA